MSLAGRLYGTMIEDPHNGAEGYAVRSLYFDTLNDKDFFEKEDGVELRRKIRIRIYHPEDDFAKLEIKQKTGAYQKKRSLKIRREDARMLTKGNYGVLLSYDDAFATECYGIMCTGMYRPKTIVEYKRRAFIAKENNIRVTFDNRIRATETSFDLFSGQLVMNPVFPDWETVLEVKFNGFLLSYIKETLNAAAKSELSVSKYCLARSSTLQYKYL